MLPSLLPASKSEISFMPLLNMTVCCLKTKRSLEPLENHTELTSPALHPLINAMQTAPGSLQVMPYFTSPLPKSPANRSRKAMSSFMEYLLEESD